MPLENASSFLGGFRAPAYSPMKDNQRPMATKKPVHKYGRVHFLRSSFEKYVPKSPIARPE